LQLASLVGVEFTTVALGPGGRETIAANGQLRP
jgi:hypothetical protein